LAFLPKAKFIPPIGNANKFSLRNFPMMSSWGLIVQWMWEFAPIVARWAIQLQTEGGSSAIRLHHLETFHGLATTANNLLQQVQAEPDLAGRRVLQRQLVEHQRSTQLQVAAYHRATALKLAEVDRILDRWPLRLYPSQLLEEPSQKVVPLKILLSLPDLGVGVGAEREAEERVAEGLRQFLQQHYSLHDRERPTEFIGGACDRQKFHGEASIKALFGVLQSQPTLILESEVAGDRLNFRIAYWGLNDGNYYYQTIAKIPYREILRESAQQRAIAWKTLRSQLIAAGEDPEMVDDLGGNNAANLAILERELRWQSQGIDVTQLRQEYQFDRVDLDVLCQYLIRCHTLVAAWIADIYHLQMRDVQPQLPQLLSNLLQEPIERSLIEAIVGGYRQMYGALAASRQSWLPELYLQLAQSLSHLPDRTWARAQLEESVRAWLELRQVSVAAAWLSALQSQVKLGDRDYIQALRDCLVVLEDTAAVMELDAILVTCERRGFPHSTISTHDAPQLIHQLSGHTAAVSAIAIDPEGCLLASGGSDRAIYVWDLQRGARVQTFTGHTMDISAIAICPDGQYLASSSFDCPQSNVKVWDLKTGQLLHDRLGHKKSARSVAFDAAGRVLFSGGDKIKVWDVRTGERLCTLGHTSAVHCIAVSGDGQLLASGSSDGKIKLWNLETGTLVRSLTGHQGAVQALAISPDGRQLISASQDAKLGIWDLEQGQLIAMVSAHTEAITSLAMNWERNLLITGSLDRTAKIWDLQTRESVATLTGHQAAVNSVAIGRSGELLATASADGTIHIWQYR
jgi:WD domain, G-beta repeat